MAEGSRVRVHAFKTIAKYLSNTVYIGFCDYGFSGQSRYNDHNFDDQPPSLHDNDPWGNNLKFRPLCSIDSRFRSFDSDPGFGTVQSWSPIPIQVLRLF